MKHILLFLALSLPAQAIADGYVLGAGRWTCEDVIRVYEQGTPSEKGELFGWFMGFWSAATFQRETGFVDVVESAGGNKIAEASVVECRRAPADTLLFRVTQSMIENTR